MVHGSRRLVTGRSLVQSPVCKGTVIASGPLPGVNVCVMEVFLHTHSPVHSEASLNTKLSMQNKSPSNYLFVFIIFYYYICILFSMPTHRSVF